MRSVKRRDTVPTQERPLYLLEFFTQDQPYLGLSELSRDSGLPKASCLRALRVLEAYGMVQRVDRRFRLGPKLVTLGTLVQESHPPRRVAYPHLEVLRDATSLSVQWVVRDGLEGLYLEVLPSKLPVQLYIAPGRRAPLYAGASTRLLLAFSPASVQNDVFAAKRKEFSSGTPIEAARLRALLRIAHRTWLAVSFGEITPYTAELAAPVFDARNRVTATISIAGSEAQFAERGALRELASRVDSCARRISVELGYGGSWGSDVDGFIAASLGNALDAEGPNLKE